MAINSNDYKSIPKSANIKIHKKNNRKFLFRFKMKVWDMHKGDYAYKQFSKTLWSKLPIIHGMTI